MLHQVELDHNNIVITADRQVDCVNSHLPKTVDLGKADKVIHSDCLDQCVQQLLSTPIRPLDYLEQATIAPELDFKKIADVLLNHASVKVNGNSYQIREIEFYLHQNDHLDLYVHQSKLQQRFNGLYFHQYKNGTYKSGTYKGMDLTFGHTDRYFGILVRGLINEADQKIHDGPCLVVNEILAQYGVKTIDQYLALALDLDNIAQISYHVSHRGATLITGPRIGLSEKCLEYKDKPYRYGIKGARYKRSFNKRGILVKQ